MSPQRWPSRAPEEEATRRRVRAQQINIKISDPFLREGLKGRWGFAAARESRARLEGAAVDEPNAVRMHRQQPEACRDHCRGVGDSLGAFRDEVRHLLSRGGRCARKKEAADVPVSLPRCDEREGPPETLERSCRGVPFRISVAVAPAVAWRCSLAEPLDDAGWKPSIARSGLNTARTGPSAPRGELDEVRRAFVCADAQGRLVGSAREEVQQERFIFVALREATRCVRRGDAEVVRVRRRLQRSR